MCRRSDFRFSNPRAVPTRYSRRYPALNAALTKSQFFAHPKAGLGKGAACVAVTVASPLCPHDFCGPSCQQVLQCERGERSLNCAQQTWQGGHALGGRRRRAPGRLVEPTPGLAAPPLSACCPAGFGHSTVTMVRTLKTSQKTSAHCTSCCAERGGAVSERSQTPFPPGCELDQWIQYRCSPWPAASPAASPALEAG